MADVRAFRSGNWSDTTATSPWWNGTAIFAPAAGDNVYSNTFTITIDTSVNLGASSTITNGAATSRTWKDGGTATATAGGGFPLTNGVTLTCNIQGNSGGGASACSTSGSISATIVGNVSVGSTNSALGVVHGSSGTLTITGNATAGTFGSAHAISNTSTGTINFTGIVTGNNSANATGIYNSSSGAINITSSLVTATGVNNASTGVVLITGNVTAGSASYGAINTSTGTFTIIGDITATNGGNGFTSSNSAATNRLSGSFISSSNGTAAVYAPKYILNTTPLAAKTRYALNGVSTFVDMLTADNTGLGPATSDVRSGISYGGGLVGTCAVPAAGSVALGVPVGSTTGTALLTGAAAASAVWDALTSSITTSGSIGERVKNCATAETTGEQIAAALSTP